MEFQLSRIKPRTSSNFKEHHTFTKQVLYFSVPFFGSFDYQSGNCKLKMEAAFQRDFLVPSGPPRKRSSKGLGRSKLITLMSNIVKKDCQGKEKSWFRKIAQIKLHFLDTLTSLFVAQAPLFLS